MKEAAVTDKDGEATNRDSYCWRVFLLEPDLGGTPCFPRNFRLAQTSACAAVGAT